MPPIERNQAFEEEMAEALRGLIDQNCAPACSKDAPCKPCSLAQMQARTAVSVVLENFAPIIYHSAINEEINLEPGKVILVQGQSLEKADYLAHGTIEMDMMRLETTVAGVGVPLPKRVRALLEVFMRSPNIALTTNKIVMAVWGPGYVNSGPQYLRVALSDLRGLIKPHCPEFADAIKTIRGVGYIFETSVLPSKERADG